MHCAAESYRQEGRGVFFRGLGTTLCRAFVVNAVLFSVYEASRDCTAMTLPMRPDC